MQKLRLVAEVIDENGDVISNKTVSTKDINAPKEMLDIGYRHAEQIAILSRVQQIYIEEQISVMEAPSSCPKCGGKLKSGGTMKSHFSAVFSDHTFRMRRHKCESCNSSCGKSSFHGMFGSYMHPDLARLQIESSAKMSYREASVELNKMSCSERKCNHHDGIKKLTYQVAEHINDNPDAQ